MIAPTNNENTKRGRGRPKGSRTAERPVVDLTATPCPFCGAIAKPVGQYNLRRIDGDGGHAVELRDAACGSCGRPIQVRTRVFVP